MNEVVDGNGLCVSSGPPRNSHLDRIQPVGDGENTDKRKRGGSWRRGGDPETVM